MSKYNIETYENGDIQIATDNETRIYKQRPNFLVDCIRFLYNQLFITTRQYDVLQKKYIEALQAKKN